MYKEITGYRFTYRIEDTGTVQKLMPDGSWYTLKPCVAGRNRACVKMRTADNRKVDVPVVWLMADAFMQGRKPGYNIVHKDKSKFNCDVRNLKYATNSECGKMSSSNRRRPVVKIDRCGNVVAVYPSVTVAAKKNFLSKTAVWHRCINKLKDPYKLDGYNYQYER